MRALFLPRKRDREISALLTQEAFWSTRVISPPHDPANSAPLAHNTDGRKHVNVWQVGFRKSVTQGCVLGLAGKDGCQGMQGLGCSDLARLEVSSVRSVYKQGYLVLPGCHSKHAAFHRYRYHCFTLKHRVQIPVHHRLVYAVSPSQHSRLKTNLDPLSRAKPMACSFCV